MLREVFCATIDVEYCLKKQLKEETMSDKYKGEYKNSTKYEQQKKYNSSNYMDWNNMIQKTITRSVDALQKTVTSALSKRPPEKLAINKDPKICVQRPKNQFFYILQQSLGIVAMFLGILFMLNFFILNNPAILLLLGIASSAFGIFSFMKGRHGLVLNNRYLKYLREIQNNSVVMIEDLALFARLPIQRTIKDIQELIDKDYFLQAHYIEKEQILILDRDTYQLYKENRERRLAEDASFRVNNIRIGNPKQKEEYLNLLERGRGCLETIDFLEEKIENKELLEKVEETKTLTASILKRISEKPALLSVSKKFVDYYLPTTVKLLESYIDLQNNPHVSSELEDAKREINLSFDSINTAYHQILTKLYEDKRLDIMTETSVLDSVLKMDGFSEKP